MAKRFEISNEVGLWMRPYEGLSAKCQWAEVKGHVTRSIWTDKEKEHFLSHRKERLDQNDDEMPLGRKHLKMTVSLCPNAGNVFLWKNCHGNYCWGVFGTLPCCLFLAFTHSEILSPWIFMLSVIIAALIQRVSEWDDEKPPRATRAAPPSPKINNHHHTNLKLEEEGEATGHLGARPAAASSGPAEDDGARRGAHWRRK